eukprot:jgi/Hompol1/6407/HPOL_000950-RA
MPLVVVCGVPLSGKTQRATQLAQFLESYIAAEQQALLQRNLVLKQSVVLLNDESLLIDKATGYADANEEKKSRGTLLSAVERHLSKETVVICDGLNYIKGFRYQLYCVARALGTPTCTIHCGISQETVIQRNASTGIYDPALFENLCSRFEEPD